MELHEPKLTEAETGCTNEHFCHYVNNIHVDQVAVTVRFRHICVLLYLTIRFRYNLLTRVHGKKMHLLVD